MSSRSSGISLAILSPTVTNRSTATFTAWPTLATTRSDLSEQILRSLCDTRVEICENITFIKIYMTNTNAK